MVRVLAALVVGALVLALAWLVASLPGSFALEVQGVTVQMPMPLAVLSLVILVGLLAGLGRLVALLIGLPRRLRRQAAARVRRRGDQAVTGALVALAARDADASRLEAARARRLLGDTPQTLLLAASAGQVAERDDEVAGAYALLAERRDAAFIGLRGLFARAVAREDWQEAAVLARRAEAARPGTPWLAEERARLAARNQHWDEALQLTRAAPDAPAPVRAAYAVAAAEAEPDGRRSLALAKQAVAIDPAFSPASLLYARRLRTGGRARRARAALAEAWSRAPQPDLATLALAEIASPIARLRSAQDFVKPNEDHPESQLLLGRLSLEAGLTGEARRHASRALAAGLDQRRLHVLLADIAEADGGDTRGALRDAAAAAPDPSWRCGQCGATSSAWAPACVACHTPGRIEWTGTPRAAVVPALVQR